MGAWGHGPIDSDQALDLLALIGAGAVLQVERFLAPGGRRHDQHEVRGVAHMMLVTSGFFHYELELWEGIIRLMTDVAADSKWLGSWDFPDVVDATIAGELADLVAVAAPIREMYGQ